MKNYLSKNTLYLTNNGLKTLDEIDTHKDNIIYLSYSGELLETNDYTLDKRSFNYIYDNYDSSYGRIISSVEEVPRTITDFIEDDSNLKISTFFIKSKDKDKLWYEDFRLDKTLSLSLVITNYFDTDEENYIEKCDFVSNKIVFDTFKSFNKYLGIYFPYNRETKSYLFRTNLSSNFNSLETKLLENLNHANKISKTIYDIVLRGYNYRSIVLRNYNLGCILQIYFNLSGYDTKLVQDNELFRLTVVKPSENEVAHREKSIEIRGKELGNITLNNDDGYLIISQCNDGITNVSFVESI